MAAGSNSRGIIAALRLKRQTYAIRKLRSRFRSMGPSSSAQSGESDGFWIDSEVLLGNAQPQMPKHDPALRVIRPSPCHFRL